MVQRDLTQLILFLQHFTVVCTTLLPDEHLLTEVCFILLEKANINKKELNEKLKKNVKLATQMLRIVQIQTNLYSKSVERGKRIIFPTFSLMVFNILFDQFFVPVLPGPLSLQFATGAGGTSLGARSPTVSNQRDSGGAGWSNTAKTRVQHPRPHFPWKSKGRLKPCIDAAAAAGQVILLMYNCHPACLTFQYKHVCSSNCRGDPAQNNTHIVSSTTKFHRLNVFNRRFCSSPSATAPRCVAFVAPTI